MRLVAGLLSVLLLAGLWLARERSIASAPVLPLSFAHQDHMDTGCVTCHHNFTDATGQGLCIDCHKTTPAIAGDIQTMFHEFCRDCHVERQREGLDTGPTRACAACHEAETSSGAPAASGSAILDEA